MTELEQTLGVLYIALGKLNQIHISEEELPDLVGELTSFRQKVSDTLNGYKSEMDPRATGSTWKAEQSGKYVRSYNLDGIVGAALRAAPDRFGSPNDVLASLVTNGVIRADRTEGWAWTKLQRWAEQHNVTLSIAKHEIAAGDTDAMVGELWQSYVRMVPVELDEESEVIV